MIALYKIVDNNVPIQIGEACNDGDHTTIAQMKLAQTYDFAQTPRSITWIVYRPDKIPATTS